MWVLRSRVRCEVTEGAEVTHEGAEVMCEVLRLRCEGAEVHVRCWGHSQGREKSQPFHGECPSGAHL